MVDQMKMDNVIALEERPAYTLTGKELATIVVLLMKDMGIITSVHLKSLILNIYI